MASTLENRMESCADRMLCERVAQALLEAGKTASLDRAVAGVVVAAAVFKKPTDAEIVAFVDTLA